MTLMRERAKIVFSSRLARKNLLRRRQRQRPRARAPDLRISVLSCPKDGKIRSVISQKLLQPQRSTPLKILPARASAEKVVAKGYPRCVLLRFLRPPPTPPPPAIGLVGANGTWKIPSFAAVALPKLPPVSSKMASWPSRLLPASLAAPIELSAFGTSCERTFPSWRAGSVSARMKVPLRWSSWTTRRRRVTCCAESRKAKKLATL